MAPNGKIYICFLIVFHIMGRIKTSKIKVPAKEIYDKYKSHFKPDFEKNKQILMKITEIPSKKVRNIIAGYITSLVKQEK